MPPPTCRSLVIQVASGVQGRFLHCPWLQASKGLGCWRESRARNENGEGRDGTVRSQCFGRSLHRMGTAENQMNASCELGQTLSQCAWGQGSCRGGHPPAAAAWLMAPACWRSRSLDPCSSRVGRDVIEACATYPPCHDPLLPLQHRAAAVQRLIHRRGGWVCSAVLVRPLPRAAARPVVPAERS